MIEMTRVHETPEAAADILPAEDALRALEQLIT